MMRKWFDILAAVLLILLSACTSNAQVTAGYTQIDQETATRMMEAEDGHIIVDVRTQEEYDEGHIPGAVCIPNESIGSDSPEALPDNDQIILVYCRSGRRSKEAARKLASMGYTNVYEFGGILDWMGEVVTDETLEEMPGSEAAILSFSSFAGGGYEYTVEVDDPSVVWIESRYEYEEHAEEIEGASFDFIVAITGLKPGSTMITVYGESPIMENENRVYSISVDETLHVTLTPVRSISFFYIYRNGDINYDSYQIVMDTDGYDVSVNEEEAWRISPDAVDAIMKIIDEYDLESWDGFRESQNFVLDGESFWLDFTLTDGTMVHASGDNVFPDHYFEAMGKLWNVLTQLEAEVPAEG